MPEQLFKSLQAIRASDLRRRARLPPLAATESAKHAATEQLESLRHENAILGARVLLLEQSTQLHDVARERIITENLNLSKRVLNLESALDACLKKIEAVVAQGNERIDRVDKKCCENAASLSDYKGSVDERFASLKEIVPQPPPRQRTTVRSLRMQRVVVPTSLSLVTAFRDKMTQILACKLTNVISADPLVTSDGFVVDRAAIDAHYEYNVTSPFTNDVTKSGGVKCSSVVRVCQLLLEYTDRSAVEDLVSMYRKMKEAVPHFSSSDVSDVVVTSTGCICTVIEIIASKRGVCPVTKAPWDDVYVWCSQVADMYKLIHFNTRLDDLIASE